LCCDIKYFLNISHESFAKISTLKIQAFKISQPSVRISAKIVIINFEKIANIGEHSICNLSTNFFVGMEISQSGGKILPKVSPKVSEKFSENSV